MMRFKRREGFPGRVARFDLVSHWVEVACWGSGQWLYRRSDQGPKFTLNGEPTWTMARRSVASVVFHNAARLEAHDRQCQAHVRACIDKPYWRALRRRMVADHGPTMVECWETEAQKGKDHE